jgi:hypothetical protein
MSDIESAEKYFVALNGIPVEATSHLLFSPVDGACLPDVSLYSEIRIWEFNNLVLPVRINQLSTEMFPKGR